MALQTIGMKPHLVQNIFADMQFSEPRKGFYVLRLYKHCQWMHILLDDAFPADEEGNALWATSEFEPMFSWPSLVEKAYAKIHGS